MFDALTNAEKHVTSNIACACCQHYTNKSVFWLTQMTLSVTTLCKFPPLFRPNIIQNAPTKWLLIRQLQYVNVGSTMPTSLSRCISAWSPGVKPLESERLGERPGRPCLCSHSILYRRRSSSSFCSSSSSWKPAGITCGHLYKYIYW